MLVPAADTLAKMANALGVSCDYLCAEAGWYVPPQNKAPLLPELVELAGLIDAYPAGLARQQAKKMIADIATILSTLREQLQQERPHMLPGVAEEREEYEEEKT